MPPFRKRGENRIAFEPILLKGQSGINKTVHAEKHITRRRKFMEDRLRFALIGCGRIAHKHAETISKNLSHACLVAVCDTSKERAETYARKYNVPAFDNMHLMMEKMADQIDVVNVLTPTGYHAAHVIELAPYGRHIVVEKPMALTLEDADSMIGACDKAGIQFFVVKQNRYNTPVRKVREALQAGRFGKIAMGTVRVRWCRRQAYYDQDAWRGTWALDGGVFSNQASHHVDLLCWMLGGVESVFSYTARRLVNIEAEDCGIAVLRFRSGALGVIEATTATRPKDLEGSISILGAQGTVEIGGFAVNEMKVWQFETPQAEDAEVMTKYNQNPPDVYGFGHVMFLQHVIDSIRGKNKSGVVDGREGLVSLRVINAIYESAATGREVNLHFRPRFTQLGRSLAS